jgi:hypothetical protein
MRAVALGLLLSLMAPTLSLVLCHVECMQAERLVEPDSHVSCHDAEPNGSGRGVSVAGEGICHDEVQVLTASVAERLVPFLAPTLVRHAPVLPFHSHPRTIVRALRSSLRPDILLVTAQLRI